jgi:predicted  nucleic acid-binding Zn-ribbon protein
MWSSTLPTGTVREEGRGSQTFPKQSTPQSPQRVDQPSTQPGRENAALQAEIEELRKENQQAEAEIQRLESQLGLLRKQLANRKDAEAAMVDRYERIVSELESAAATAPESATADSNGDRYGLLSRLKNWF